MPRRKGERTARMNERDFPHIVELAVPERGFGTTLHAIHDFHRDRGLESRRGRRQRRGEQEFVRWCFIDPADAAAFADQFGGTRIKPAGR
jgi:hypothetical protein